MIVKVHVDHRDNHKLFEMVREDSGSLGVASGYFNRISPTLCGSGCEFATDSRFLRCCDLLGELVL